MLAALKEAVHSALTIDEQLCDGWNEIHQAEEATVAKAGQDPPLHEEQRALDLRLVVRMLRAYGQHCNGLSPVAQTVGNVGNADPREFCA